MRTSLPISALAVLVCVLAAGMASAAPTQFWENWESYTNGATPYGSWQLQTGTWGSISTPGLGGGKCFSIASNQKTRIQNAIDLDVHSHVALQGWLLDSAGNNRSVLGLGRSATATDTTLIRMGAGGASTYTIQYYDGGPLITVDTGLPVEAGWHFIRLDISYDGNPANLWSVTWRIWNAARTVEKKGSFGWHFDKINCNYVTLGAAAATPGAVAWDDVKIGSLVDVGPPPEPWEVMLTAVASSWTGDFYPANAIDRNAGTVWSSAGHGASADATEWLAVDFGHVIPLTGVRITPRPAGLAFPIDYRIDYTTDWIIWTTVPGAVFSNQPVPTDVVTHNFGAPILAHALRIYATELGADDAGNHYCQVAEFEPVRSLPWANPSELRAKKVIGAGQYSALNVHDPYTPTPKFLADHPEYIANHPFDGLSIPVKVDHAWCASQGLVSEPGYALHDLVMTKLAIPYSAVQDAVTDLNRVSWGHLTDNFLWYTVRDGTRGGDFDVKYPVDPASSSDWAVVVQNAALCARICREANLKGFIMDTEMYTSYATGELYPFGKGTPEVWRQRGQTWIQAVQAEYPAIKILLFFSWGPESAGAWPGYEGLRHFMNGVLDGIQSPARLIHGWESTFWYGGTRIMPGGETSLYPGDRSAFLQARTDIKNVWRNYSDNPAKYDQFVDAGMAAWVESDPYSLVPGWPSGFLSELPWSNLPYALAYSDEYVWVWSQHTHYPRTLDVLNPFLASIANRTFNTGREAATLFAEDFQTDPLRRGWYFDFDMLDIGREVNPGFLPAMNTEAVSYVWSPSHRAVRVQGAWMTGLMGETVAQLGQQRRRFVHPLQPLSREDRFQAELDFQVETFGSDPANRIVLGLFNSSSLVNRQSVTLQIRSPGDARITLVGDGTAWVSALSVTGGLKVGRTYRVMFNCGGTDGMFRATLMDMSDSSVVAQVEGTVPGNVGQFQLDEVGAAMWDADATSTPLAQAYRYRMERVTVYAGSYSDGSIGGAKYWPDGFPVELTNKILYFGGVGFGYAQEEDRSSGIRVAGAISASEDHLVTISGVLRTNSDGERYVELTSMTEGLEATAEPLALTNRDLGGASLGLQSGVWDYRLRPVPGSNPVRYERLLGLAMGLNNIGLLVAISGVVTYIGPDYFYIHDGSGIDDGDELVKGVRVAGVYEGQVGDYVMVTGASSCVVESGNIVRLLVPKTVSTVITTP